MSLKNYIPKDVTQQSEFLKKYPEYDGRGIKIGIIDSDIVDKSLPGMQKTTDGLPKIIECFGKYLITIDTSKIVERNGKNYIIGLNAEKLYIPIKWKNPSDKWHLGSKSVFEIKMDGKKSGIFIDDFDKTDSKRKLAAMKNKTLNCIVWFDGKQWRACIYNTSLYNFQNLEKIEVLTHFEDEQEGALNSKSKLSCKISDDGNTLQFFGLYDDHATLVSHVLAANFPDNPESNGLAPGAQIVSIQACILEAAV
uniref:Peptidase S8/S53 domain-containing protein n=1 Tax=Panagrolaimus superbus TaxID=310955 RepID=A0A914YAV2_9BILA